MLVTCKYCTKSFDKCQAQIKATKNNFCSRSCAASFNNKGKAKNKAVQRTCIKCKEIYYCSVSYRNKKCCMSCRTLSLDVCKNLTIADYINRLSVNGRHSSWAFAHIRESNRRSNYHLTKLPCAYCTYAKHVELAHIKPVISFNHDTKINVVNSPSNVIQLCRNCHWEFDNGLLSLEEILARCSIQLS